MSTDLANLLAEIRDVWNKISSQNTNLDSINTQHRFASNQSPTHQQSASSPNKSTATDWLSITASPLRAILSDTKSQLVNLVDNIESNITQTEADTIDQLHDISQNIAQLSADSYTAIADTIATTLKTIDSVTADLKSNIDPLFENTATITKLKALTSDVTADIEPLFVSDSSSALESRAIQTSNPIDSAINRVTNIVTVFDSKARKLTQIAKNLHNSIQNTIDTIFNQLSKDYTLRISRASSLNRLLSSVCSFHVSFNLNKFLSSHYSTVNALNRIVSAINTAIHDVNQLVHQLTDWQFSLPDYSVQIVADSFSVSNNAVFAIQGLLDAHIGLDVSELGKLANLSSHNLHIALNLPSLTVSTDINEFIDSLEKCLNRSSRHTVAYDLGAKLTISEPFTDKQDTYGTGIVKGNLNLMQLFGSNTNRQQPIPVSRSVKTQLKQTIDNIRSIQQQLQSNLKQNTTTVSSDTSTTQSSVYSTINAEIVSLFVDKLAIPTISADTIVQFCEQSIPTSYLLQHPLGSFICILYRLAKLYDTIETNQLTVSSYYKKHVYASIQQLFDLTDQPDSLSSALRAITNNSSEIDYTLLDEFESVWFDNLLQTIVFVWLYGIARKAKQALSLLTDTSQQTISDTDKIALLQTIADLLYSLQSFSASCNNVQPCLQISSLIIDKDAIGQSRPQQSLPNLLSRTARPVQQIVFNRDWVVFWSYRLIEQIDTIIAYAIRLDPLLFNFYDIARTVDQLQLYQQFQLILTTNGIIDYQPANLIDTSTLRALPSTINTTDTRLSLSDTSSLSIIVNRFKSFSSDYVDPLLTSLQQIRLDDNQLTNLKYQLETELLDPITRYLTNTDTELVQFGISKLASLQPANFDFLQQFSLRYLYDRLTTTDLLDTDTIIISTRLSQISLFLELMFDSLKM